MSEPTSSFPTPREWEQQAQPVWVIAPPRQRWWLYGLFLLLTMFSTMVVGARMQSNFLHRQPVFSLNDDSLSLFPIIWIMHRPANLLMGIPFSFTLMFILFAHEMGHYLYARHYHVDTTLPFFVPFPSLIGTLGAFIRIKGQIPSRAALFDIGIAGPIAGFIPACIALVYGLSLSHPIAAAAPSEIQLGFPLAFHLAAHLLHITTPITALSLHPIAAAAWVGMFATALNLLPGGQLDGGHIVFSISSAASLDLAAHSLGIGAARKILLDRMVSLDCVAGADAQTSQSPALSRCHRWPLSPSAVLRPDTGPNLYSRTVHTQFRSRSLAANP